MRLTLAALIVASAVTLTAPLSAQNPGGIPWEEEPERRMTVKRPVKGEWMFGVDAGRSNFLPVEFEEKGTRFVGMIERNVAPWLGLQADLNCAKGTVEATVLTQASNFGVCSTALSAVVPIPVAYSLWPYLRIGGGVAFWDEDAVEGFLDIDHTAPAFVAAVGTRWFPLGNDKWALRVDIQRTQTSLRDLDVGQWGFGFGVTLRVP